jgi:hypothetical protein
MNKTDLKQKTKEELLKLAQRLGLRGISTMNKPELVQTISAAQARRAGAVKKKAGAPVQKAAGEIKRRAVRKRPNEGAAAAAKPTGPTHTTKRKTKPKGPKPASAIDIGAHKFDVAPARRSPKQVFAEEHLGDLPESYGTGRLFLAARDPHWLFAYWDLTHTQMDDYRRQSSDGRVVLRLFERGHADPIQELTLQADSRNWYIPVNKAATSYSAELGFWKHDGNFYNISRSREATTPPDHVSADTTARFATIPLDVKFEELLAIMRTYLQSGEELAEALHRLQAGGVAFPFTVEVNLGPWTETQAAQMERALGGDILKRTNIGSIELTEWLRRRLEEESETSSGMFSAFRPAGEGTPAAQASGEPAAKTGRVGRKVKQPVSGKSPKAR